MKTLSKFNKYVVGEQKHTSLYLDWYNTGDIGYVDTCGEVHVINRLDDVIIVDSHKVYPSDVESHIIKSTTIKECAVANIQITGNEFIGCLYVSDKDMDKDIKEKIKTKMMIYEIPKVFLRCNALPKTENGKVSKQKLQAYFEKYVDREFKL